MRNMRNYPFEAFCMPALHIYRLLARRTRWGSFEGFWSSVLWVLYQSLHTLFVYADAPQVLIHKAAQYFVQSAMISYTIPELTQCALLPSLLPSRSRRSGKVFIAFYDIFQYPNCKAVGAKLTREVYKPWIPNGQELEALAQAQSIPCQGMPLLPLIGFLG